MDVYSKCFYYQTSQGDCGSVRGVEDCCQLVKDCKRDIQQHLVKYHLSGEKVEQSDFVLARAGKFDLPSSQLQQTQICAKELGRGWRKFKTSNPQNLPFYIPNSAKKLAKK